MNEKELYDKTVKCIRCGFCLEACPTFRLTGQETESPRGRIYLVRSAIEEQLDWQDTTLHLDRCLGCRACETACPSGVEYGDILEMARAKLESTRPVIQRNARAILLNSLTGKASSLLAKLPFKRVPYAFSKALSGESPTAELPKIESRATFPRHPNAGKRGTVSLLTGCVMDSLFHSTNQAARYLLQRQGFEVRELTGMCCGALDKHAGREEVGEKKANKLKSIHGPIIVTSAGCGSSMKDAGLPAKDLSEFLTETGLEPPQNSEPVRIVYQDACHLLHGQRIQSQPRHLLDSMPGVTRAEIDEPGMCCGSAGIYNITQPSMAKELLDRKWRAIHDANPQVVVTTNPGCLAWLSQAAREKNSDIRVVHLARFIAERCHNLQA